MGIPASALLATRLKRRPRSPLDPNEIAGREFVLAVPPIGAEFARSPVGRVLPGNAVVQTRDVWRQGLGFPVQPVVARCACQDFLHFIAIKKSEKRVFNIFFNILII